MEVNNQSICPHGKPQSHVDDSVSLHDVPFCLECKDCRLAEIEDCEANNPREEVLNIVLSDYPNSTLYYALKEKGY